MSDGHRIIKGESGTSRSETTNVYLRTDRVLSPFPLSQGGDSWLVAVISVKNPQ